jgi:hypothetical protein
MVLLTRSASLFSSRAPSLLLASVSRHARTTGLASRGSAFNPPKFSPLFSHRLLTTRHEKVKVLAVLYDGGKHAEQVRSPTPLFRSLLLCLWPLPIPHHSRAAGLSLSQDGTANRRVWLPICDATCRLVDAGYRGAHLRHGPRLQGGRGKVSASSEKWGCHREDNRLGDADGLGNGLVGHPAASRVRRKYLRSLWQREKGLTCRRK